MNPCKITEDLLPLYVDNTCSPGSREYVKEHVKTCPACKALLESMKQPVEIELPRENAKKSFRRFSNFLVRRRVLTITLCVLLGLSAIGLIALNPIISYISETLPIPIEDIDAQVYRLSDGTLYAELVYTGDEHTVAGSGSTASTDGVYTLRLDHTRLHDLILENDDTKYGRYIPTEDSDYVDTIAGKPCRDAVRIVLTDGEQEIVLWEKGQDVPAADEDMEYQFIQTVNNSGFYQKREGTE